MHKKVWSNRVDFSPQQDFLHMILFNRKNIKANSRIKLWYHFFCTPLFWILFKIKAYKYQIWNNNGKMRKHTGRNDVFSSLNIWKTCSTHVFQIRFSLRMLWKWVVSFLYNTRKWKLYTVIFLKGFLAWSIKGLVNN